MFIGAEYSRMRGSYYSGGRTNQEGALAEVVRYFKGSLCLDKLTNFGVKCAKRSVKI